MRIQADVGVAWVLSFLSTYRKKTYCLYEATPDGPAAPAEEGLHPLRQLDERLLRDIGISREAAASEGGRGEEVERFAALQTFKNGDLE
jgi:hypothetical protein